MKLKDITGNPLDKLLPKYGQPASRDLLIWDEGQQMFITDQYISQAGHTYYLGVRVSENLVTVLHFGLYHSWTYINDVDVYAFNGKEKTLIGRQSLDTFYKDELVRETVEGIVKSYLKSQTVLQGLCGATMDEQIEQKAKDAVIGTYRSLLNDPIVQKRLADIRPIVLQEKNQYLLH